MMQAFFIRQRVSISSAGKAMAGIATSFDCVGVTGGERMAGKCSSCCASSWCVTLKLVPAGWLSDLVVPSMEGNTVGRPRVEAI